MSRQRCSTAHDRATPCHGRGALPRMTETLCRARHRGSIAHNKDALSRTTELGVHDKHVHATRKRA